jgi:integrase
MPQIIKARDKSKPAKPYPDFPLFPHATKRWAKKVHGKLHYFGHWSDPQGALDKWLRQKDDLLAGRIARSRDGLTIRDLANQFLTVKRQLLDSRELAQRSFDDYQATCQRVIAVFGLTRLVDDLRPADFDSLRASLVKTWGPVTVGNEVQRIRVLFKYAYDAALTDKPVRFGPGFKRPNRQILRQARHEKGPRMFEAKQIKALLREASPMMKAMIMLGINCGFSNNDVGTLKFSALDLKGGWVAHPRPKTAIMRRCPLWPETVSALKAAIKIRPTAKEATHNQLVFITRIGLPWSKEAPDSPISKEMAKLVKEMGSARSGLNFYALRHTFEAIGGETNDQVAVDHIMGHAPAANDMAAVYRERVTDERLVTVTDYVHKWLFSKTKSEKKGTQSKRTRRPK